MEKVYNTSAKISRTAVMTRLARIIACLIVTINTLLTPALAADYYWVGGSGNWSDISHWATSSGGSVNHMQVPSVFDDVYFDQNSFTAAGQSVTVNSGNYKCRNMNWTGALFNPTFKNINGYSFILYGSLTLIPAMTFNYAGVISFESNVPGNTITMAGKSFASNVYFDGIGGEWSFTDAFSAGPNAIYFNAGKLVTNGQTVTAGSFYSLTTLTRELIHTSGTWNLVSGYRLTGTNLTLNAGTSVINISSTGGILSLSGNLTLNDVNFTAATGTTSIISSGGTPVFNNVVINNNANITGNNIYNNLTFAGTNNTLKEGNTQTITGSLNASGNCASPIFIRTAIDTVQAFISKSSGSLNLNYVFLKGISAVGGATFNAVNSADLGNNSGWNVTNPASHDLYWVGGTGNWDDPAHWAFASGGAGGSCVPTPFDNVYFDANSFSSPNQTVNVNCFNAFCNNMTWTGVSNFPIFTGPTTASLYIFGSLAYSPNMSMTFRGPTYFKSYVTGRTVLSATQVFGNHVYFDRPNGGWILLDDINSGTNIIYLVNGSLDLNQHNATCAAVISSGASNRELLFDQSVINITGTSPTAWMINNTNLVMDASNSVINFVSPFGGMFNCGIPDSMRYNIVNFTASSGTASLSATTAVGRFNSLSFSCNASISGNNVTNNLNLSGSMYILGSSQSLVVRNNLTANGTCSASKYFYASVSGTQAKLVKYGSNVVIDYAILKDIQALGSATFTANNSIDLGNNSGWTINAHAGSDLYWVGGAGNWNDPAHWSTTSGGIPGACIPTPEDNVFFDANSFSAAAQFVDVNVPVAFCRNMTWTGVTFNPEFKSSLNGNLYIYGSLTLSPSMNFNYNGPVMFTSVQTGKTITSAGRTFKNSVYFTGIGGGWTLTDPMSCLKNIEVVNGSFNTNNQNINTFSFVSAGTALRSIDLGTSLINVTANSPAAWNIVASNLTLSANQSEIRFTRNGGGMTNTYGDTLRYNKVWFLDTVGVSSITSRLNYVKFRYVYFRCDGNISGVHTFDTLSFYPSKTYVLEAGKTQRITSVLNMRGNGCFPITLRSSQNGVQSSFYKSSGVVSAAYVDMRDQNAYGGAGFFAGNNSVNVANNTGWVFGTSPGYIFGLPDTLYMCQGDTADINTFNFVGGVSFEWQDGSQTPVYHATHDGKYWVEVTYADHCFVADTIRVLYHPQPFVSASQDTIICSGSNITLSSSAVAGSSFLWSTSATTPSIVVNPTQATTYVVNATNVCGTATDSIRVDVYPQAVANAGSDTVICTGAAASLHASGLPGSSYLWNGGQTQSFIQVNPAVTTTYSVTVTDPHACGTAADQMTVFVMPVNNVNAGADATICNGAGLQLTATSNPGVTYSWSNGMQGATISVQPSGTTTYTVTVSDSLGCTTATDDVTITVNNDPQIVVSQDTGICFGTQVTLNVQSQGPVNVLWSTSAVTPSITVNPTVSTSYYVSATNSCGTVNDTILVTVYPLATANAGHDTVVCSGSPVSLTASGLPGSVYTWSNSVNGPVSSVTPLVSSTYTVSVTDPHQCHTATDQVTVYVMSSISVDAGADQNICSGNNTNLSATSMAGASYLWSNGAATSSITVNPGVSTQYQVTVTDSLGCASATDGVYVNVNYAPVVNACADRVICPGTQVQLTASGTNASNYSWNNGATGDTISVSPLGTTIYNVSLSNICGTDQDQVVVFVMPPSAVSLGNDITICSGSSANLNAVAMAGSSYVWNTSETTQNIIVNPISTTTYQVTVSDSLGCSQASDQITVNVEYMPMVNAGADITVCEGEPVVIIASSSTQGHYLWSTGDTNSFLTFNASSSGIYSVSVTNFCGTSTDDMVLTVNPLPVISLSASDAHCNQPNGHIIANGGVSYLWSNGATTPSISNIAAGSYTVTVSNGECFATATTTVNSIPGPSANFSVSDNFVYVGGGEIAFHDQSTGSVNYWEWSFGDGGTALNEPDPTHQYDVEGNYIVTLWVKDQYNCIDSATRTIKVQIPNTFSMPNAFSPNDDGLNDGFGPVWYRDDEIVKYNLVIADRWGTIVYDSQDLKQLWYGKDDRNGKTLPQGIYTWVLKYEQLIEGRTVANTKAGVVTLL